MLDICFVLLMWNVDPLAADRPTPIVAQPVATCMRPSAQVTKPDSAHASIWHPISESLEITRYLKRWEQSTAIQPEWSRSQHDEFRRMIVWEFNEHTAAATAQFIGPIRSDVLGTVFDWTIVMRTNAVITLEAVPRDEMDRLFYRSVRVSLVVDDGTPREISVIGRNQREYLVWKSEETSTGDRIQLVHFEDEVPPTPKPLVRTADAKFD
jgi:hypothetical protein